MSAIDYLSASNGDGEAVRAIITDDRGVGNLAITVDSVLNWPAKFVATSGTIVDDEIDPDTLVVFKGYLDGSFIMIEEFAPGYSDVGNTENQVVVLKPATLWADLLKEAIEEASSGSQNATFGTWQWVPSSTTPSYGQVAVDTALPKDATTVTFNNVSRTGQSYAGILEFVSEGSVILGINPTDPTERVQYKTTGDPVSVTDGVQFTVEVESFTSSDGPLSGWTDVNVVFLIGGAGGGGGGSTLVSEVPAGAMDGSNQDFTLTGTPATLWFYWNGAIMAVGDDYTVAGNVITTLFTPTADDHLFAIYSTSDVTAEMAGSNSWVPKQRLVETPDGVETVFHTQQPYVGNSLSVFKRGLNEGFFITETDPATGEFEFDVAPAATDDLFASFQHSLGVSGNADTVDGYHVSPSPAANTLVPLNSSSKFDQTLIPTMVLAEDTQSSITNATSSTRVAAGVDIAFTLAEARKVRITLEMSVNMNASTTSSPAQAVVEIMDADSTVVMRRVPTIPNNSYNYSTASMSRIFDLPAGDHEYSVWLRTSTNCNNIGKDVSSDVQLTAEVA